MAIRRIRQLGDPVLRERSIAVMDKAVTLPGTWGDLRDTLHEFQRAHGFGRGISAVQIGVLERVIYVEFAGATYCLVNPELVSASEERFALWDDCFSFPDLLVWLERAVRVAVRYRDENGLEQVVEAEGALAELLQHEMDHLDGVLAVDRAIGPLGMMTRGEWQRRGAGGVEWCRRGRVERAFLSKLPRRGLAEISGPWRRAGAGKTATCIIMFATFAIDLAVHNVFEEQESVRVIRLVF